jgi:hypothetical protein
MNKILVTNEKTGALEIKTLDYDLPLYSIGTVIGYDVSGVETEAIIEAIHTHVADIRGEIVCQHTYETVDGDEVLEEEVKYYYPEE